MSDKESGIPVKEVLRYLLDLQEVKHKINVELEALYLEKKALQTELNQLSK